MSNCVFPGEGRGVHEESTHHAKHKFGLHFSLINHSILQEEGAGRKSTFDHNGGGGSGFWQTINLDHEIYEQPLIKKIMRFLNYFLLANED